MEVLPVLDALPQPHRGVGSTESPSATRTLLDSLRLGLSAGGLDILEPVRSGSGRSPDDHLAVLVGNSRALWQGFLSAYAKADSGLQEQAHPLDTYVEEAVQAAAGRIGRPYTVEFAHERGHPRGGLPSPRLLRLQRAAANAGLVLLEESCDICVHPKFGPWFALRALLVFPDVPALGPGPPRPVIPPLSAATLAYLRMALRSAETASAIELAEAAARGEEPDGEEPSWASIRRCWKRWAALRDIVLPGHPMRYSRLQLEYHYTHDAAVLRRAVAALQAQRSTSAEIPLGGPLPVPPPRRRSLELVRAAREWGRERGFEMSTAVG